jgi:hypothetical protein
MRKKYKNELFELLLSSKYGVEKFELEETTINGYDAVVLKLNGTPFFFTIRNANDDFDSFDCQFVDYAPSFPLTEFYPEHGFFDFSTVLDVLKNWLDYKIEEYFHDETVPDLWGRI